MSINKSIFIIFLVTIISSCQDLEYEKRSRYYRSNINIVKTKETNYNYTIKNNKKYTGYYKIGKPYTVNGITYYPKEYNSYNKVGKASWYGADFHNKKTANGEIFNMHDFTAAHNTLQLPCIVKVTNLENGKNVIVRVNDRGPFVEGRIIDLSKAAADKLDFKNKGIINVRVELLKNETEKMLKSYGLKY